MSAPAPSFPPRLHVLLARDGPAAVVIRRGPSRQTRLILWDRRQDTFTPGQWLKARLYERRCDLSPDGRLFAYFALTGYYQSPAGGTYTAISRPPYFTALALWPKGDSWHGGGLFAEVNTFYLHGDHRPPLVPASGRSAVAVTRVPPLALDVSGECLGLYFPRLRRDGWTGGPAPDAKPRRHCRNWTFEKDAPGGLRLVKHATSSLAPRPGRGVYYDEHELLDESTGTRLPLPDSEWADVDAHRRRIVFAARGRILEASVAGGQLHCRPLADFNNMTFEPIASPPWARTWTGRPQ